VTNADSERRPAHAIQDFLRAGHALYNSYNGVWMSVNRKKVLRLTERYGGDWAIQHAQRLIRLVEIIGEGMEYDSEAIWLAAHMHDWGTLPGFCRPGVAHCDRSRELAEDFLRQAKCPPDLMIKILEAIEFHHGGADGHCNEAVLLHDADALDGIGVMGVLREFAMIPTEGHLPYPLPVGIGMAGAYERAKIRMENNPRILRLPKARRIARRRVQ